MDKEALEEIRAQKRKERRIKKPKRVVDSLSMIERQFKG
jgi:hypothetical protein